MVGEASVITFFMKFRKFIQYLGGCFLLALFQVSISTFWSTYTYEFPTVTGRSAGTLGFDATKLLCFSSLPFKWVVVCCLLKNAIVLCIGAFVPEYSTQSLATQFHIIQWAYSCIPEITQLFLLRRYHNTKKVSYFYLYFLLSSLEFSILFTSSYAPNYEAVSRNIKLSSLGKNMKLLSFKRIRDSSLVIDRRSAIWRSISGRVCVDFMWMTRMSLESFREFFKKKPPFWTYILLASCMLISWSRINPQLEIFFACIAYFFLCYMSAKILIIARLFRIFIFLPFIFWSRISYLDFAYGALDIQVKFICCAVLICLDYLFSYYWESEN
jgi:hypothetical protein